MRTTLCESALWEDSLLNSNLSYPENIWYFFFSSATTKECSKKCSKEELEHINRICDAHLKQNKAKQYQKSKSAKDAKVSANDSDKQATSFINEQVNCDGCGKTFFVGRSIKVHLNRSSNCFKGSGHLLLHFWFLHFEKWHLQKCHFQIFFEMTFRAKSCTFKLILR